MVSLFEGNNILVQNGVKIELTDLGEGIEGDYDVDDLMDVPLLRMDVYVSPEIADKLPCVDSWGFIDDKNREWVTPSDCSYCTQIPIYASPQQKRAILTWMMEELYSELQAGNGVKRICQSLSWMSLIALQDESIIIGRWVLPEEQIFKNNIQQDVDVEPMGTILWGFIGAIDNYDRRFFIADSGLTTWLSVAQSRQARIGDRGIISYRIFDKQTEAWIFEFRER